MAEENIHRVKVLPLEDIYFIKKINLENSYFSGVLCYARKLYEGYKIQVKEEHEADHLFVGYKEEDYPSDKLDEKILEQLQDERFPNAFCHTSLMLLDVEKGNNQRWAAQMQREVIHISIEYIPADYQILGVDIYQRDIEAFYYPAALKRHKRAMNISIVTEDRQEYDALCFLLHDTYTMFTNACNIQEP